MEGKGDEQTMDVNEDIDVNRCVGCVLSCQ